MEIVEAVITAIGAAVTASLGMTDFMPQMSGLYGILYLLSRFNGDIYKILFDYTNQSANFSYNDNKPAMNISKPEH